MTNYELPIEISIFDFQNLDFTFLNPEDSYFLRIFNVDPVSSFYLLEAANRDYLQTALNRYHTEGKSQKAAFTGHFDSSGNWGLLFIPAKMNEFWRDFMLDMRMRLSQRSQDMKGVLDVGIYDEYILRDTFRFWDAMGAESRRTLLLSLNLDDDDRQKFSLRVAEDIYQTAYGLDHVGFNNRLAAIGIMNMLMKITKEVHSYGSSI